MWFGHISNLNQHPENKRNRQCGTYNKNLISMVIIRELPNGDRSTNVCSMLSLFFNDDYSRCNTS